MDNGINPMYFVIPGLTRNPVFSWIPAFAGMTSFAVIYIVVYNAELSRILSNAAGGY